MAGGHQVGSAATRQVAQPEVRLVVEVRVAQVRHISLYGGGGAVAVEREVVQGEASAARRVVEVRVAQVRLNSPYGGGGGVGEEREGVEVQVPALRVRL